MSTTVAKALALLDYFSEETPEIGLSDLARQSKIDKATVHRMMSVMADAGLIEQRADTKLYRLGAGIIRLASVREASFPMNSVLNDALGDLTAKTEETSHASMISGRVVATVGILECHKSSRVSLESGQPLPYHATASGLAILAFKEDGDIDRILSDEMASITDNTLTDPAALRAAIADIRANGYAIADQTFEEDVYGIAMPVFDQTGIAIGALAVATPAHRMNDALRKLIVTELTRVAKDVTLKLGGRLPASFLRSKAGAK